LRSRGRYTLVAEPPFTRSMFSRRLSTFLKRVARFSGRDAVLQLLQYVRRTGTYRERVDSSYSAGRGDDPSPPWPSTVPLRGRRRPTSRARQAPEGARVPVPGRLEERFALSFDGRVPFSNRTAHLRVMRARRRGAEPPLVSCSHRADLKARERAPSPPLRSSVPHPPAKGDAFARKPRCVPPSCAWADARGSLLALAQVSLPPRGTCAPRSADALQFGRACAFSTARSARRDEPSTRWRLNRTARKVGCVPPSEPLDRSAQKRLP